jgi:hypothetical protein
MIHIILFLFLVLVIFISHAHAYVGPGLGLGVIGALIGVVTAVFLAIIGVFWYPLKRLLRKFRSEQVDTRDSDES